MTQIIAIDPGDTHSALVHYRCDSPEPIVSFDYRENGEIIELLRYDTELIIADLLLIEDTPTYTMTMKSGRAFCPSQVKDTAFESGRMVEAWGGEWEKVSRLDVKKHLLGRSNGNDAMVSAAVYERYGGNIKTAKGKKSAPGPLFGFNSHVMQALALAITWSEKRELANKAM